MSWNRRIVWAAAFTLFGAFCWAAGPYWTAALRSEESRRGRRAHEQVAQDTPQTFAGRAAVGGAAGLVVSLIPISTGRRGKG